MHEESPCSTATSSSPRPPVKIDSALFSSPLPQSSSSVIEVRFSPEELVSTTYDKYESVSSQGVLSPDSLSSSSSSQASPPNSMLNPIAEIVLVQGMPEEQAQKLRRIVERIWTEKGFTEDEFEFFTTHIHRKLNREKRWRVAVYNRACYICDEDSSAFLTLHIRGTPIHVDIFD